MSEFETAADQHINDLIKNLCRAADRCFDSEADKRQMLIDQICQLRASQTPTIIMKTKK